MRTTLILLAATGLVATAAASSVTPATALFRARAEVRAAEGRVRALEARAATATSRAARARAGLRLAVARISAAESGISAAEASLRVVGARRTTQRARLAVEERPTVVLLAGLQTLARRPPALSLLQRGDLQDLVHTRALLASTMPAIAARTRTLRADLAIATRIQRDAGLAATTLRASRAELDVQRRRLAEIESVNAARGRSLTDAALGEGDRVLSLGEDARAIVTDARRRRSDAGTLRRLAALPAPSLAPGARPGPVRDAARPAYLFPVDGRVVTGAGEISDAGVHARGTTIATEAGAEIVAPASGRVVHAAPFRSYGRIVIVDHGGGWTTTITDLASLEVAVGDSVSRGETLGAAGRGRPRVTIELRQSGRPVPIAPLL